MQVKIILSIFLSFAVLACGTSVSSQTASISIFPSEIRQGDPFMAQIDGAEISSIKKITFNGKKRGIFMYQEKPSALVGIDLNQKPGTYKLVAEFSDGSIVEKNVEVVLRDKKEIPLGIPSKLGGNTKASQEKLVTTLNTEWKSLIGLKTNSKALWTEKFILPLKETSEIGRASCRERV